MTIEPESGSIIPQLILVIILTAINAFFSSAEMAIVSVNKNKVKYLAESGNKKAILLEKVIKNQSNFLATIQVGITLASFFSSASAATGISSAFSNELSKLNIPYAEQISVIIVTVILSYFTLVFGELVPKRMALQKKEKTALSSVKVIYFTSIIAKPFIKILSVSTALSLKLIGVNESGIEEKVSKEEIQALISEGEAEGAIDEDEKEMLNGIFEFNDRLSKEIMTSRKDTYMLDISSNISEYVDEIINVQYSRIPVYEDGIDNIVGILYIKDFFIEARKVGFENVNIRNILHKPYFVPETKRINELFKELQLNRNHMAILIDEYGGFSGIVTMEDLIEEVMGDIDDEYDMDEPDIKKLGENKYLVKGTISIYDFNEEFGAEIEEGDYDTLNGYITTHIGKIPKEGVKIEFVIKNIKLKVLKVRNRRIEEVEITILEDEKNSKEE
ncbi:transporter associated domain protein [Clostridium baratii str. Sullivan]|uniref:Transporter associated domain protein n=1 Tax=Clostridium baratii str. Sullivan TaxID=1415775 RepID=A0A0A7FRT6_9CLOT|nr:hemolysin family protein [Clostridium baratii]AIY82287.1 transporter associated domain protein [Clostridium baratii str. Sullivan]